MDPIAAVVVIAGHLARLSTAYFPKPSNLNSEDGLTGEVLAFINPTLWGTIMLSAAVVWLGTFTLLHACCPNTRAALCHRH